MSKQVKIYGIICSWGKFIVSEAEAEETPKLYKIISDPNGAFSYHSQVKKANDGVVVEGMSHGSYKAFTTDKAKVKDLARKVFDTAISYQEAQIKKHNDLLASISALFEKVEYIDGELDIEDMKATSTSQENISTKSSFVTNKCVRCKKEFKARDSSVLYCSNPTSNCRDDSKKEKNV
jgi:hypothetical protein